MKHVSPLPVARRTVRDAGHVKTGEWPHDHQDIGGGLEVHGIVMPGPPPDTAAPRFAGVTEASIAVLVDHFYEAVRRDPILGPVFEAEIAEDEWPEHLATLRRFWSSVMLATGRYSGNPVAMHRAIQGLERPMFARWLELFEATVTDLFAPGPAGIFIAKANRIATSLQLALFHRLGATPEGLQPRPNVALN